MFLQMLFLGTSKYPQENHYKVFLNKNGGSSNAGTGMQRTTYMFDINHGRFDTALDIFSQFFKEPLFNEDATAREIQAVDSEVNFIYTSIITISIYHNFHFLCLFLLIVMNRTLKIE